MHNDCSIDAVFGLDGHVQRFADALAAAGYRIDRPPSFESLTDVSDNRAKVIKEGHKGTLCFSSNDNVVLLIPVCLWVRIVCAFQYDFNEGQT